MERESFIFYRSFYNCLKNLSVEDRDKLSMAIFGYALDGVEPEIDWILVPMFELIRPQIDANNKRFMDGQKWWAPKWNKNAKKWWSDIELASNLGNQYKTTTGWIKNNHWLNEKQPNVNVNVNVNDNVNDNDNEKECEEKQDTQLTLDANASRWNTKDTVGEKNNKCEANGIKLSDKLKQLWLEDEVIELAITYNWCKKWKKLDKFKEPQLKIWVDKLRRCWFNTIEWMIQVLENSIAGWYEWIFELKTKPIIKQKIEEWRVVNVNWANIFF